MRIKLDQLRGRKVFDANGREIGRVNAPLVDMETWVVDTLRIAVSRHAAAGLDLPWSFWMLFWRPQTIDVATGHVHAAADAIILRVSLAELREAALRADVGEPAAVH